MYLIVGLGNPGKRYEETRHNIGFMTVDRLLSTLTHTKISKNSFKGELYKADNFLLLKPQTFMNLSGESVSAVVNFYKPDEVIVIHDDLDLKLGALRYKRGGGHGGHNGLKSIDSYIGKEYIRVRMGIGRPVLKEEVAHFVLQNFTKEEFECVENSIDRVSGALKNFSSLEETSSRYSQKGC